MVNNQNPINEIKRTEEEADILIEKTQKKIEENLQEARGRSDKDLKKVGEDVVIERKKILAQTEDKIKEIKIKEKNKAGKTITDLEKNASSKINQAIDFIVSKIFS